MLLSCFGGQLSGGILFRSIRRTQAGANAVAALRAPLEFEFLRLPDKAQATQRRVPWSFLFISTPARCSDRARR
jgi:hypothetical protein